AIPLPMPVPPPVTMATLPLSFLIFTFPVAMLSRTDGSAEVPSLTAVLHGETSARDCAALRAQSVSGRSEKFLDFAVSDAVDAAMKGQGRLEIIHPKLNPVADLRRN